MKILAFSGSLRKDSLNRKLVQTAKQIFEQTNRHQVDFVELRDFSIPVYDGDFEDKSGMPAGVTELCKKIMAADAIAISTPEYNGGIPGGLKNALDWISRHKPNPLKQKYVLLMGASPGRFGAIRSLWHSKHCFDALLCYVYPDMFALSAAHEAFDSAGQLKVEATAKQLKDIVEGFVKFAGVKA